MGGYSALPQNKNVAGVWFLTTNEVKNHKLSMLWNLKKNLNFTIRNSVSLITFYINQIWQVKSG